VAGARAAVTGTSAEARRLSRWCVSEASLLVASETQDGNRKMLQGKKKDRPPEGWRRCAGTGAISVNCSLWLPFQRRLRGRFLSRAVSNADWEGFPKVNIYSFEQPADAHFN